MFQSVTDVEVLKKRNKKSKIKLKEKKIGKRSKERELTREEKLKAVSSIIYNPLYTRLFK